MIEVGKRCVENRCSFQQLNFVFVHRRWLYVQK